MGARPLHWGGREGSGWRLLYLRKLLCRSDHQQNCGSLFCCLSPSVLFPKKARSCISPRWRWRWRWRWGAGGLLIVPLSGALAPGPGEKAREKLPEHLQHHGSLALPAAATALLGR